MTRTAAPGVRHPRIFLAGSDANYKLLKGKITHLGNAGQRAGPRNSDAMDSCIIPGIYMPYNYVHYIAELSPNRAELSPDMIACIGARA